MENIVDFIFVCVFDVFEVEYEVGIGVVGLGVEGECEEEELGDWVNDELI